MNKWCRNSSNPTTGCMQYFRLILSIILTLIELKQVAQYKFTKFSMTCSCFLSKFEEKLLIRLTICVVALNECFQLSPMCYFYDTGGIWLLALWLTEWS